MLLSPSFVFGRSNPWSPGSFEFEIGGRAPLQGESAKKKWKLLKLCMQGLDLVSYRSMGLPGVNLASPGSFLDFWKKVLLRYYVTRPLKVLVKKNFHSKYFWENAFLWKYKRLTFQTWICCNPYNYQCFLEVSRCLLETAIFLHCWL